MPHVTVDAELYQQATVAAAAQGKSVGEFVDDASRQALSRVGVRRTVRNGLPVMVVSGGVSAIDPVKVCQCLERAFLIGLPDINVLLALVWSHHVHHDAAHGWFTRDAASRWATCLWTPVGFLRLSLHPRIVGVSLDGQVALNLLQSLVEHPHHQYAETAPALTAPSFSYRTANFSVGAVLR